MNSWDGASCTDDENHFASGVAVWAKELSSVERHAAVISSRGTVQSVAGRLNQKSGAFPTQSSRGTNAVNKEGG